MSAESSASDCLENSWEMKLIAQPVKWLENQLMKIKNNYKVIYILYAPPINVVRG